jgi:hypothetical protein
MAGVVSVYRQPGNQFRSSRFRSQIQAIAAQVAQQFPGAAAKSRQPHDDGEFIQRLAWACLQAGIPCGLNGKRGNVNDMSLDVLTFENETGTIDSAGHWPGLEVIDVIVGHETPSARVDMLDVTVVENPPGTLIMPPAAFIAPRDLGGGVPTPGPGPGPGPGKKPYPGDGAWAPVGDALFADYAAAGQSPNPGMSVWFGRTIWDHVNEGLTLDQSIAKHRAEWRSVLGLPPV